MKLMSFMLMSYRIQTHSLRRSVHFYSTARLASLCLSPTKSELLCSVG
jgi:hypothetical protein